MRRSEDGQEWEVVDKRAGQTFAWDKQTRVFTIDDPGTYAHYRLVPQGAATLAEVELIA